MTDTVPNDIEPGNSNCTELSVLVYEDNKYNMLKCFTQNIYSSLFPIHLVTQKKNSNYHIKRNSQAVCLFFQEVYAMFVSPPFFFFSMTSMSNSLLWEGLKHGQARTICTIFKTTSTNAVMLLLSLGLYERAYERVGQNGPLAFSM